jgi:hypothetical protein
LASSVLAASPAAAADWRVQSSFSRAVLRGVSCASRRACTAVGGSSSGQRTAAERWNGARWAAQRTPNPAASSASLGAVSCRVLVCVAVGYQVRGPFRTRTLSERWDGGRWRIQPTPRLGGGPGSESQNLSSVSCPSTRRCFAVGARGPFGAAVPQYPVVERWAGGRWSAQRLSPLPFDFGAGGLDGVSCPTARACLAVGVTPLIGKPAPLPGSSEIPFAERWNGKRWRTQTMPVPAATSYVTLGGVSCTSARVCTAVGAYSTATGSNWRFLAERWDGATWAIQGTPSPPPNDSYFLSAVSCTKPRRCTAVGNIDLGSSGRKLRTLAERWNGVRWQKQNTPNPHVARQPLLTGVSCTTAVACTAVGSYGYPNHRVHGSFVERYS